MCFPSRNWSKQTLQLRLISTLFDELEHLGEIWGLCNVHTVLHGGVTVITIFPVFNLRTYQLTHTPTVVQGWDGVRGNPPLGFRFINEERNEVKINWFYQRRDVTSRKMTKTHLNRSRDTFIFPIILSNIWQSAASPYIKEARKAARLLDKKFFI